MRDVPALLERIGWLAVSTRSFPTCRDRGRWCERVHRDEGRPWGSRHLRGSTVRNCAAGCNSGTASRIASAAARVGQGHEFRGPCGLFERIDDRRVRFLQH